MNLNDFIARACSFFDKAEAGQTKEVAESNKRITDLEAKVKTLEGTVAERDATIKDLTGKLEKAQNEVNTKGAEVAKLTTDLEAEKQRTTETLASMGVDPKTIPAKPAGADAPKGKGILAEYNAIEDSAQRVAFYRKHKAEIDAAWGKD